MTEADVEPGRTKDLPSEEMPSEIAPTTGAEDITGDRGVVKEVLKHGTGWEAPATGDEVSVHYVGTLLDGTKFDSSRDRNEPFVFEVGKGRVIKGWDAGLKTMKQGEVATLTCKPEYAYGEAGHPPSIPSNSTLVFEVELLGWKSTKDITDDGDGGVLKSTVKEGEGYRMPKGHDEILVHYWLKVKGEEQPFQQSPPGGLEIDLNNGVVCPAFDIALKKMKKSEKAAFVIQPAYGPNPESLPSSVPADAVLEAELELVDWKQVSEVTDDGLVSKKVLYESTDYNTPNSEAKVKIRYTARLADGTIFDERGEGEELEFLADEDQVIEGLDLAVMKMKPTEKAEITIAAQYAFKDKGFEGPKGKVPGGGTVIYTVELLSIEKSKESYEMTTEEKLAKAAERKEAGNEHFKGGANTGAVKRYKRAVDLIGYDDTFAPDEKRQSKDIKKSCNLNMAAAYLKLQDWKQAQAACGKVLETDAGNVKALYRRAQAYLASQDYVEAEQDIKALLERDASNRDARTLQQRYKKEAAAFNQKQRSLYSNMFKARPGKTGQQPQVPETGPQQPSAQQSQHDIDQEPQQPNGTANGHAEPVDGAGPASHPIDV